MEQQIKNISSETAKKLIEGNKDNKNFIILDVRTKEEFDSGHLENAVNLDMYSPDFQNQIDKLDKNKTYLVYCEKGGRSRACAEKIMTPMGFQDIYNLEHGFSEWQ